MRSMGRAAYGVKGIELEEDDEVVGVEVVEAGGTVLTVTENGYGKRTVEEYRRAGPGRQGHDRHQDHRAQRPGGRDEVLRGDEQVMLITKGV